MSKRPRKRRPPKPVTREFEEASRGFSIGYAEARAARISFRCHPCGGFVVLTLFRRAEVHWQCGRTGCRTWVLRTPVAQPGLISQPHLAGAKSGWSEAVASF